jgi:hypothetical protein
MLSILAACLAIVSISPILAGGMPEIESPMPAVGALLENSSNVTLTRAERGWQLLRNGQPYSIRGVGAADGSLKLLAQCGGNSIRTWGTEGLQEKLDAAARLGLTVTAGIWLGHERHGFDYANAAKVAEQKEAVRRAVLSFRDHPALLIWALGNEMEGYGRGDNARIWLAVNDLAAMAKQLDPHHPTMTVIAEIGGDRVQNIHRLCPDVDIVGINSYGGAASLGERYQKLGGTKPWVLTEFGPAAPWESSKTAWGASIERSSSEKAISYRRAYEGALREHDLCLGSYAFLWGHKQETTSTWFGMLLPGGTRTAAVDVMQELWSGRPPPNRCPKIRNLSLRGAPDQVPIGKELIVSLDAIDPEGDPISVSWAVREEPQWYATGGDAEEPPAEVEGRITNRSSTGCRLVAPPKPGAYRVYVTVSDSHGGCAVANIPFRVLDAHR